MSLQAYQRTQNITQSPRDVEYRVFAKATRQLIEVEEGGVRDKTYFSALDLNRRLWSALAVDCSDDGNALPVETRAQVISLSIWVSKYSSQASRNNESLQPLIDINKTIMEGLAQRSEGAAQAAPGMEM